MIRDQEENEIFTKADQFKCAVAEPWTARPLHSSIIAGRNYTIEVAHPQKGTHKLQCDSQGHVERWLADFHNNKSPDRNNRRRHATQLELWVSEAKGLPTKNRRYYAEVHFNDQIYARTSIKEIQNGPNQQSGSIVWGEYFEFPFLPDIRIETIRLHIYRESDKKKNRKDKDYIGLVNIPISSLTTGQFFEKWFPLSTPKSTSKSEISVRMKTRYQSLKILPLELYKPFAEYLTTHYLRISQILGPAMSAEQKERVAGSMVRLMMDTGKLKDYLTDLMELEVKRLGEEQEALLFRENSIGSKSIESFLKLVCRTYLCEALSQVVSDVISNSAEIDCEVDKERLSPNGDLEANRSQLTRTAYTAVRRIIAQKSFFPSELREVYVAWRERTKEWGREKLIDRLIAGSLFLRLLCPALLTPSLFALAPSLPNDRAGRTLTLTAKIVQSMANGARFGAKEDYLSYLNEVLDSQREEYKNFVHSISTRPMPLKAGFEGHVELGVELAKLQQVLSACLAQNEDLRRNEALRDLRSVLEKVKTHLDNQSDIYVEKTNSTPLLTPRRDPLSFQNPSFHSNSPPELIPINLNQNGIDTRKALDELDSEVHYLQESIGMKTKNELTSTWLNQNHQRDPDELMKINEELESKILRLEADSDKLQKRLENSQLELNRIFSGNNNNSQDQTRLILERATKAEQMVQSERHQMQQVIDAKQRLVEKQSYRISQLEGQIEQLMRSKSAT